MSCECEINFEYNDIVDCISSALDTRDPYMGNHSRRVSDMVLPLDLCRNEIEKISGSCTTPIFRKKLLING